MRGQSLLWRTGYVYALPVALGIRIRILLWLSATKRRGSFAAPLHIVSDLESIGCWTIAIRVRAAVSSSGTLIIHGGLVITPI